MEKMDLKNTAAESVVDPVDALIEEDKMEEVTFGDVWLIKKMRGKNPALNDRSTMWKFDSTVQGNIKETCKYWYNLVVEQLKLETEKAQTVVPHFGDRDKTVFPICHSPPSSIDFYSRFRTSYAALDLIDTCGTVNDADVYDMLYAMEVPKVLSRIQVERLKKVTGINKSSFSFVEEQLEQVTCDQARTVEYARLSIIYKRMLGSSQSRYKRMEQAETMETRCFGLLPAIPAEIAKDLCTFTEWAARVEGEEERKNARSWVYDVVREKLVEALQARIDATSVQAASGHGQAKSPGGSRSR